VVERNQRINSEGREQSICGFGKKGVKKRPTDITGDGYEPLSTEV
jgi:hypothetical protein